MFKVRKIWFSKLATSFTVSCLCFEMVNSRGRACRMRKRLKNNKEYPFLNANSGNLYALSKWMGERGYKPVKKLKPKIFCESGRGLMAEETIRPGDVIISIPKYLLITPKAILNSYLGKFFEKYYPKATGHEILSVFLMCEHAKGQSSEWHHYISSLPEEYSIPVYFCQHSLMRLPRPVYASAQAQCDSLRNSFSRLKSLFNKLQTLHPAFKDILNFDLYKWAWSSVNTRCIFMECLERCPGAQCTYHLALAPFLDLLNHSADVQVHAGFNKETNHYEIISHNKFKKYSQVFISYGCHDNQKLFLEYGFTVDNNYNDCVSFSLDDILLAYKLCNFPDNGLNSKLKYIKENNLSRNSVCTRDGISWNLSIVMKILISEYDIRLWNSFLHNPYAQQITDSKYQKFKDMLINTKIQEYKLNVSHTTCAKCSSHQCLISNLCSNINSILIKVLS